MAKLTRIQFVVEGFGEDASEVTRAIGFEPTGVASCGFSSLPKRTSWYFELSEIVPADIAEHVEVLVRFLQSHAEGVRSVAARFGAHISIVVDDRDWIWPDDEKGLRIGNFELSPSLTAAVASLGLGIAIQVCCGLEAEADRFPIRKT